MQTSRKRIAVWTVLGLLAAAEAARAGDDYWIGTNNAYFSDPAAWTGTGTFPPAPEDTVNFTNRASYTVNFNSNPLNTAAYVSASPTSTVTISVGSAGGNVWTLTDQFVVSPAAGTTNSFTLFKGGLTVTNAAGNAQVIVGQAGVCTKFLVNSANNGAVLRADRIVVAQNASPGGSVLEASGGSALTGLISTASLVVGASGGSAGTVTIGNSGRLLVTNAAEDASLVLGATSGAAGTLTLAPGASRACAIDTLIVATNPGGIGTFTWTSGGLTVNNIGTTALGANASDTNAILSTLLSMSQGGVSTQTIGWSVSPSLVYTNGFSIAPAAGGAFTVSAGGGTVAVTNADGTAQLVVGGDGKGTLTVASGGSVTANHLLCPTTNRSVLGMTGGSLTLLGNSILASSNTSGTLTLNAGTLNVLGGTCEVQNTTLVLAGSSGSPISMIVDGANTLLTLQKPGGDAFRAGTIGGGGAGRLTVTNGARATLNGHAWLGYSDSTSGARLQVVGGAGPGAPSQVDIAGNCIVSGYGPTYGSANDGVVVSNGARLSVSGMLKIGGSKGNNNFFDLSGADSVVTASNFTMAAVNSAGDRGENHQAVIRGGRFSVTNALGYGNIVLDGYNATFSLQSGLVEADRLTQANNTNDVNYTNQFVFGGGTLSIRSAVFSNGLPLVVGDGVNAATLRWRAGGTNQYVNGLTVSSNAMAAGSTLILTPITVNGGGTLAPGDVGAAGNLIVSNALTLAGGATLAVDVNGSGAGTGYDQVRVSGDLIVSNSILNVSAGYVPAIGQAFVIVANTAGQYGTFRTAEGAALPDGSVLKASNASVYFQVAYHATDITLTACSASRGTVVIVR